MQDLGQGFYVLFVDVPELAGLVFGRMQGLHVDIGGAIAEDKTVVL